MKKTVSILMMAIMLISMCGGSSTNVNAAIKVKLSQKTATIYVGCSKELKLKNAVSTVKWKSADESIAKVSKKGKVTGIKSGTTKITATYRNKTYNCKVKVKSCRVADSRVLPVGQSYQLWVLKRFPKDSTETVDSLKVSSAVKWESSDNTIAKVNKNGLVMARKEGTVEITAKVKGETYTCLISVVKALGYDDFAYNSALDAAETHRRYWSDFYNGWRGLSECTVMAKDYSHFSGLLNENSSSYYWYRCYINSIPNEENRGIVIGDTIEDVWEKYGQAGTRDNAINQAPTGITNWYSTSPGDSLKQRQGITSKMTYYYKDINGDTIVDYYKRFYFDENNTLILIEWSMHKQ